MGIIPDGGLIGNEQKEPMKPKPLLERYKVYVQSSLGMGKFGFKYGTIEEIYSPDDLTDNMDEVSLSQRLEEHRASGKSLIAKLAYMGGEIITISPHSLCDISVKENREDSETPKN